MPALLMQISRAAIKCKLHTRTSLLSSKSPFKSLHYCLKVYSPEPPPPSSPTSFSNPSPYDSSPRKRYTWKLEFRLFRVWGTCIAIMDFGWGGVEI